MPTLRQLIQDKIIDSNIDFKEVAGAASLKDVLSNRLSVPGCYLFRQRNQATDNKMIGITSQNVTQSISIVIVTNNVRDARGADSSDDNEFYCEAVQAAILGWQPGSEYDPLEYNGGALASFKSGLFVWQETYKTSSLIRSN